MKKFQKSIFTACLLCVTPLFAAEQPKTQDPAKPIKPYLVDVCIVSDEKLGEMGKPYVFVHVDQEIKLCCKHCKPDFEKDPAAFLKKLDEKQAKPK